MTGLSDFQVAMVVMGSLLAFFGLAVLVQARRPVLAKVETSASGPAQADDLAAVRSAQIEHDRRLAEVEHNIAQVRTMMGALPSKDAVHRIEIEVAELKGDLKLNNAQTTATANGVERIMSWLMDDAKKRAMTE